MARVMVFLMTLMFVLPSDGSSQDVPSLGDRILIKQVDGTVLTGRLAKWSEETIQLYADSGGVQRTIAIPRSQIATLERQQVTRSKSTIGAVVGMLVGGGMALATLPEASCNSYGPCFSDAFPNLGRLMVGMAAGSVVGALVGPSHTQKNWVIVPLIEVPLTGQGTSASEFGFGLHARVGLP